jgi:hypothetical protein
VWGVVDEEDIGGVSSEKAQVLEWGAGEGGVCEAEVASEDTVGREARPAEGDDECGV